MDAEEIFNKIIDENIIGSSIKKEYVNGELFIKIRRSKLKAKIPEVDENVAYITGAIFGDGSVSLLNRRISKFPRTKITIYHASKSYLTYVNNLLFNSFGIKGRLGKKKDKNCFILVINSKIIWLYFTKLMGLKPAKKRNLSIPVILKEKNLFRMFLAGLMDTDGYFSDNTFGIMLGMENKSFLEDIVFLANRFYKIEFRKICSNILMTSTGPKKRTSITTKVKSNNLFRENIPMVRVGMGPPGIEPGIYSV